MVERNQVDCPFKHTDLMGKVFKHLTQRERIVMQGLNKRMYLKVPTFIKTVRLISFPKLNPKH